MKTVEQANVIAPARRRRRASPFAKLAFWLGVMVFLPATSIVGLQYRGIQQDEQLISALKKGDSSRAIRLLNDGASANACELEHSQRGAGNYFSCLLNRFIGSNVSGDQAVESPAITLVYPELPIFGQDDQPTEDLPLVRAFVEHGANVNAQNNRGFTLLHKAVMAKHAHIVRYLLEHGANPNTQHDEGRTPLVWANSEIAGVLIDHGADVNITDVYGDPPLIDAVVKLDSQLVLRLLNAGARVNIVDIHGLTPLHYLVMRFEGVTSLNDQKRSVGIAKLLITHGARTDVKNENGRTSLDEALRTHNRDLVKLLETRAPRDR